MAFPRPSSRYLVDENLCTACSRVKEVAPIHEDDRQGLRLLFLHFYSNQSVASAAANNRVSHFPRPCVTARSPRVMPTKWLRMVARMEGWRFGEK